MTRKKPLTCKVCGKKFYHSAKNHPLGRLRKHIKLKHPSYNKKIVSKAKRTRSKKDQLTSELEYTDDMIVQSMMNAGIPITPPTYQPVPYPNRPVQHQDLVGALLTAIKIAQLGGTAIKAGKELKQQLPKRKKKK